MRGGDERSGELFSYVDLEARIEARRLVAALIPYVERNIPVVGLEPSCVLTLRDELADMLPSAESAKIRAHAALLEDFLAREVEAAT